MWCLELQWQREDSEVPRVGSDTLASKLEELRKSLPGYAEEKGVYDPPECHWDFLLAHLRAMRKKVHVQRRVRMENAKRAAGWCLWKYRQKEEAKRQEEEDHYVDIAFQKIQTMYRTGPQNLRSRLRGQKRKADEISC